MAKQNVLDEFMAEQRRRALEGPAARLLVEQGVKRQNGAHVRINAQADELVAPVPEVKREEPTQMHYKPAGHQPAPSANGPGMGVARPTPIRLSPQTVAQGIAVQAAMDKINPLDRFMAEHRAKAAKVARPSAKLVTGITKGVSM